MACHNPLHHTAAQRPPAYTTTLTTMARLAEMGLLRRHARKGLGGRDISTPALDARREVAAS
jgi:hypothetical protein